MKNAIIIVLAIALYFTAQTSANKLTEFEIYTEDNIYYFDGLRMTNEADEKVKIFSSTAELREFISDLTADNLY